MSEAKVVAILNQKGGVGKTTISTNVAHRLHTLGFDTLLVDADPQGSARTWSAEARENSFPVIGLDRDNLPIELFKMSEMFEWVVIDGAPQLRRMSAATITAADVVLIPVQPSPYDIWATEDLVDLVKARQDVRPELKAAFVVSGAIKKTKLGGEVREALAQFELPVFVAGTTRLVHYPTTAASGQTVYAMETHQACKEINDITAELIQFSKEEGVRC